MKIIGITGKSGSGKSTFASLLAQKLNCPYVDIDKIGHGATSDPEISKSLCKEFGQGILSESGNIDRKKLGNIVFSDKSKMDILTHYTWIYMKKQLDDLVSNNTSEYIVFDWALLPICDYWSKCDFKILVSSNINLRKNAVLKRDNISSEYFDKREASSVDYSSVTFDYTFENDYVFENLNNSVDEIKKKFFG